MRPLPSVKAFELVVKDRAGDKRMGVGGGQPTEQSGDQMWRQIGGRSHVNYLVSRHDATPPCQYSPVDQAGHQNPVRLQQVLFGLWFPGAEAFVGSQGLFHLLHLAERGNHPLALQNAAICASLKVLPLMANEP